MTDKNETQETTSHAHLSGVVESTVLDWLIKNGFSKCYGHKDYDCVMRIHVLHSLYWSENLKHFAIGVYNEGNKKGPAGIYEQWHYTLIPKPIYTVSEAKRLISGIT